MQDQPTQPAALQSATPPPRDTRVAHLTDTTFSAMVLVILALGLAWLILVLVRLRYFGPTRTRPARRGRRLSAWEEAGRRASPDGPPSPDDPPSPDAPSSPSAPSEPPGDLGPKERA